MPDPNNKFADIEASLAALGQPTTPAVEGTSYGPTLDKVLGYSRAWLAGPTFNLADEAEARIASLLGGKSYEQELADITAQNKRFAEADTTSKIASYVAPIASGLILNPLGAIGKLGKVGEATSTIGKIIEPTAEAITSKPGIKILQSLVSSVPTQAFVSGYGAGQPDNRLSTGLLTGALGTGGSILANLGGRFLTTLGTEADRMKLSAYGLSANDVARNIKEFVAKKAGVPKAEKIPIVGTLKTLESKGLINPEADVLTNAANIDAFKSSLGAKLGTVLEDANKVADSVADFQTTNADKYIAGLGGTAKEAAQELIDKERAAIISQFEEGGSLLDLQKAKTGLNYSWDQSPLTPTVQKAIRQDLREEIENRLAILANSGKVSKDTVSTVKDLNKQYGDAADLFNAFLGKAGKVLSGNVMEDIAGQVRTSGGAGTLAQMATQSGNVLPAIAGALMQGGRSAAGKNYLAELMSDPLVQQLGTKLGYALTEGGTGKTFAQLAGGVIQPSKSKLELTTSGKLVEVPQTPTPTFTVDDVDRLLRGLGQSVEPPTPTLPSNPKKSDIEAAIEKTALKYDVPVDFAKAVAATESNFKPNAKSKAGALGIFQLMPGTASDLGVDPLDPMQNIDGGIRYLAQQLKAFGGDKELAAAAYNWGPARIEKAKSKASKQGLEPTWNNILDVAWTPGETQKYVSKVLTKANAYRA